MQIDIGIYRYVIKQRGTSMAGSEQESLFSLGKVMMSLYMNLKSVSAPHKYALL